ncbi:MAG: YitT family protein [Lachnospiraceae bacterium]|nr:YitT family protein [Lachnospiraceae bacterium]MBQ7781867.1 YitT family protein [Lachnospiraceae bacterium]
MGTAEMKEDLKVNKEKVSTAKIWKKRISNFFLMTAGSFCYAAAISLFLDPNNLAPGGVTGIAIILNRLFSVSTGTMIFLLNIPIMLLGFWKLGGKLIVSTLYCIALASFLTDRLGTYGAITEEPLLAALAGAVLVAVGMGGVFKAGSTTGGTDIIIKVLRLKMPHIKTGALYLILDAMVVTASAFVFKDIDRALYAGIAVFVASFVLDIVLYGRDGAKLIYIISDKSEQITQRLLAELEIGVTYINGKGAYSGKDKKVIMCVMRKQLAPRTEDIIKEEDPEAFMIVSSATEIFGEGYKSYFSEKL